MSIIKVEDLKKTFRIAERQPGMAGAIKGLVSRKYRTVQALNNISFTIEPGELVGYIGPNGAGKSTTIKILSGIMVPDSGGCRVMDYTPWKDRQAYVAHIGAVFGQRSQLWWDLPVIESFDLLRNIYRVNKDRYQKTLDNLVGILDLSKLLDVPVRQLSLGQRMRCDIAASLIHSPKILFLDEPTIGLDAISKLAVRDFVKRLNREQDVTIILTTHDMDDIESLCTRILVIGQGQLLCDGSIEDLRRTATPERWLIVDLEESTGTVEDANARLIAKEANRYTLAFDPSEIPAHTLISRIASRYPVADLFVQNPPIETIIKQLYEDAGS